MLKKLLAPITTWTFLLNMSPVDVTSVSRASEPRSVPLSDLNGNVVLINFWGTWCVPCLREIPELVALSHRFKSKGLEVVGIAVDSGRPEDIRTFMAEHRMDYLVLIGDLSVVRSRFHVIGFPTSLLIDRHGMIRKRYVGPQTEEVLKHDVESLLSKAD